MSRISRCPTAPRSRPWTRLSRSANRGRRHRPRPQTAALASTTIPAGFHASVTNSRANPGTAGPPAPGRPPLPWHKPAGPAADPAVSADRRRTIQVRSSASGRRPRAHPGQAERRFRWNHRAAARAADRRLGGPENCVGRVDRDARQGADFGPVTGRRPAFARTGCSTRRRGAAAGSDRHRQPAASITARPRTRRLSPSASPRR